MKAPELLLPAGGLERMRAAYDYGADAVYAGSPRYSLRARTTNLPNSTSSSKALKKRTSATKNSS